MPFSDKSSSDGSKKKKKTAVKPMASVSQTLSFVFACGPNVTAYFSVGSFFGILNGLVYPALAYLFSTSFSDISAASNEGLAQVRELAFTFLGVGAFALLAGGVQNGMFELVSYHASQRFRLTWFRSLLRQDPAYFDVNNVGGIANQVGPNATKYRRGVGRKFGEGIQFLTTGVGGLGYAFWSSWRVALVVLTAIPLVSVAALATVTLNQTKGARAAKAYKQAGGVAYTTVSAIKTVLSLNAIPEMIRQYKEATKEAFDQAVGVLIKQGIANGSMLGSFLLLYGVLTLYGTSLFYRDIRKIGCDPSDGVIGNIACESTGPDVFGAMLGVAFAAQGISQFGNFSEAFTQARVAVYEALKAIERLPGAPEETLYKEDNDEDDLGVTTRSSKSKDTAPELVEDGQVVRAILPKYEIDSTSDAGKIPKEIRGDVSVQNIHFCYPTRPGEPILKGMNAEVTAGQMVAFVGPSGSGKSTIIQLLLRFYDPLQGKILLDGVDLKDINVKALRKMIGYVGQEPSLFATTIRGNIKYGNPDASDEEVEAAARLANAHDFISSFSDGYDTQVGDKGSQLSGGQKQRIAIARVLVGKPRILLLDEATSALDSESELVVQDALDNILQQQKITTFVIAHRLSTIRNADVINVVHQGLIVESGTHDELMQKEDYYFRLVQKQDGSGNSASSSRNSSSADLTKLDVVDDPGVARSSHSANTMHIEFENVNFSYPTRPKKRIFDNFSLKIKQGETVALVGPSGQGKSTTVGLIERFYDPTEGSVMYMGHDIRSLNVSWYRDQIGYVGQEPTLFNDSIARNIAYGFPGATRAEIEEAARQANAHDFIMEFPEGYDTPVGERGTQLSGGQKQRVAIARALVKKPALLIMDEATSALDSESEAIVQAAIDQLMQSKNQTVILIAHRLSTVRSADKIAYIGKGKVLEFGSHDELVQKKHGLYKRLFDSSKQSATLDSVGLRSHGEKKGDDGDEDEDIDWEAKVAEEEESAFDPARARGLAKPDSMYLMIGSIGAIMAGGVFPMWGILFAEMIELLFRRVEVCPAADGSIPGDFGSCEDYWSDVADDIQDSSFVVSGYWAVVIVGCVVGNILVFWGFGRASERLNRRLRDDAFTALLRQDVAYFDKRSVGSITSQLQDDTAKIHAFSGEPVRAFLVALSSVVTGVVLSFIFMWQFALLAIGCVPLMGFATSLEMKQFLGEDEGDVNAADGLATPGGIVVETLLNIRTVAALTLEDARFEAYEKALHKSEPNFRSDAMMAGFTGGISQFIQQWINALQMWFGGYLLFTFPEDYVFKDFLISNFAVLFSLFGLGAAFQDASDSGEVKKSCGRIFHLLDHETTIDPLSSEGKKID